MSRGRVTSPLVLGRVVLAALVRGRVTTKLFEPRPVATTPTTWAEMTSPWSTYTAVTWSQLKP